MNLGMCIVGPLSSVLISPLRKSLLFCLLGAMASKEKQVVKSVNMESAQQENEEQSSVQNEEGSCNSKGSEGQKNGRNVKLGRMRRLVPNFRWAIPNKNIDHNEMGDDVEKFVGQMMEIRRKTKEQQMRHHKRFQTPEPDNHYDFCLIP